MIVAVSVSESLQADGVEQHQRGLDEFTAIGISQINHSTHHKCGHGGGVVSDVVIDPRRQQRKSSSPDVVANRVWFEQLREAILTPEDESTDTAGEATPEPVKESEAPHPFS